MTRQFGGHWKVLVLLVALICVGSWALAQVRSNKDRAEVAKMFERTKTVCAGRYLVDVPYKADTQFTNTFIGGFQVDTLEESVSSFLAGVARREADINTGGRNTVAAYPVEMVEAHNLHVMAMNGRVLVYKKVRDEVSENAVQADDMSVEAHAHTGGVTFTLSAAFTNLAAASAAEALLARLRLRREDEIPDVSGFCIERAVFVDRRPDLDPGTIALLIGLPGHAELAMVMDSSPGGPREYSLIQRVAGRDVTTEYGERLCVTKLRKSMRSINGIYGEEVLERVRELNFATTYGFVWASEDPQDLERPPISLELQAGTGASPGSSPSDASLHTEAMLALWDSIVSSIRLRNVDATSKRQAAGINEQISEQQLRMVDSRMALSGVKKTSYSASQPIKRVP